MNKRIFINCNHWDCCPVSHSSCHKPLFIFIIVLLLFLFLSSSLLQRSQYSRTNLQCSKESKVKTGWTEQLNSFKVSYRADLDNYEDLIKLSVRRFLSQISSSVPWLAITAVGLCKWICFVGNHTSAYPALGNHHVQRHCHQTLREDWCYREACDWRYFGGDEGGRPKQRPRHWQFRDVCCLQSRGLPISSQDVLESHRRRHSMHKRLHH